MTSLSVGLKSSHKRELLDQLRFPFDKLSSSNREFEWGATLPVISSREETFGPLNSNLEFTLHTTQISEHTSTQNSNMSHNNNKIRLLILVATIFSLVATIALGQQTVQVARIEGATTTVALPSDLTGSPKSKSMCNIPIQDDVTYLIIPTTDISPDSSNETTLVIQHFVPRSIGTSSPPISDTSMTILNNSLSLQFLRQDFTQFSSSYNVFHTEFNSTVLTSIGASGALLTVRYNYVANGMMQRKTVGKYSKYNVVKMMFMNREWSTGQWTVVFDFPEYKSPLEVKKEVNIYSPSKARNVTASRLETQVRFQFYDLYENQLYDPSISFPQRFSGCNMIKVNKLKLALGVGLGVGLGILVIVAVVLGSVFLGTKGTRYGRSNGSDGVDGVLETIGLIFFCFTICDNK